MLTPWTGVEECGVWRCFKLLCCVPMRSIGIAEDRHNIGTSCVLLSPMFYSLNLAQPGTRWTKKLHIQIQLEYMSCYLIQASSTTLLPPPSQHESHLLYHLIIYCIIIASTSLRILGLIYLWNHFNTEAACSCAAAADPPAGALATNGRSGVLPPMWLSFDA